MRFSSTTFLLNTLSLLLPLTTANPTPIDLTPRCGSTVYPTILQTLNEASPGKVHPNTLTTTSKFHVAQTVTSGIVSSRIYQIVAFESIPSEAYACQLNVQFPSSYPITIVGNPTLNVSTLYSSQPEHITYPNTWSWSAFYPPTSPPFGGGLFGTVNLMEGQTTAINSEACEESLAFVFEIASWIGETASVKFTEYIDEINGAGLAGVYLTHSC